MKMLQCLMLLSILISCASITPEQMKKEVVDFKFSETVSAEDGLVYMVRPSGVGGLIRFNVFLDDREDTSEMGYTRGGQYVYFYTSPGKHKIESKAENWGTIDIDIVAGKRHFIKQEPSMGFFMARNSLEKINDLQGKYYVKKCSLGTVHKTKK